MISEWPAPIAVPLAEYQAEEPSFRKLHRMVDTFEALIKYAAAIAIQNFCEKIDAANSHVHTYDPRFKEIRRPALGHWCSMLRETLKFFARREDDLFCRELYLFQFKDFGSKPKMTRHFVGDDSCVERLLYLRNKMAHGATLPDREAADLCREYAAKLTGLMEAAAFLADLPLLISEQEQPSALNMVHSLMGADYRSASPQLSTGLLSLPLNHVTVCNSMSNVALDLHPLLLYTECKEQLSQGDSLQEPQRVSCNQKKVLIFNDLKKPDRASYLDYWRGHHSLFQQSHPYAQELGTQFPPPPHSGQSTQRFDNFIWERTEYFVGRAHELTVLDRVTGQGSRRAVVVLGAPGMGKSTLLARWADLHQQVARHFIMEGDAATTGVSRILDNLGQQVGELCKVEWKPPSGSEPAAYRQAFMDVLRRGAEASETRPIVVVLDGLDEEMRTTASVDGVAERETLLQWLPDPRELPERVRFILSARPELLKHEAFRSKFDTDKAVHLNVDRLTKDDIRALLYQVRSKYEVLESDAYLSKIVECSEGSPLYLRMLLEDLAEGQTTFGQGASLPVGITAYFGRILDSIESAGRKDSLLNVEERLRDREQIYEPLITNALLSRQQVDALLEQARADLEAGAACPSLELLILFCLVREPINLDLASQMLGRSSMDVDRAFDALRTVLTQSDESCFTIFHSGFNDYVLHLDRYSDTHLNRHSTVIERVHTRLLEWCADWKKHNNIYALQYYSTHLLEVKRYHSLIDLVDLPFLKHKAGALRSFLSIAIDCKIAVQAAADLDDYIKMLGLALAHRGLQARVAHLGTFGVIPLFARYGDATRALRYAEMIESEVIRSTTMLDVAREIVSADAEWAGQIVQQALSNCRSCTVDEQGDILSTALQAFPEYTIAYLEQPGQLTALYCLRRTEWDISFHVIDQTIAQLNPQLQRRLEQLLIRAFHAATDHENRRDLGLLLVRLMTDIDAAAAYASSEEEHIIVGARRDLASGDLNGEMVHRIIKMYLHRREMHSDVYMSLLRTVVTPAAPSFLAAIHDEETTATVRQLEENGYFGRENLLLSLVTIFIDRNEVDLARQAFLDSRKMAREGAKVFGLKVMDISARNASISLEELVSSIARNSIQEAYRFLDRSEVAELTSTSESDWTPIIVAAASEADRVSVVQLAEEHGTRPNTRWADAAVALARVDLEAALSLWNKLDNEIPGKEGCLVRLLANVPLDASPAVRERTIRMLESEFRPAPQYQLYKVPLQLEIAIWLKKEQPQRAKEIVGRCLPHLEEWFVKEDWSVWKRSAFILRLLPLLIEYGAGRAARRLVESMFADAESGVPSIGAALLLHLLFKRDSEELDLNDLRSARRILTGYVATMETGAHGYSQDMVWLPGESTTNDSIARLPYLVNSAPLVSTFLCNSEIDRRWRIDFARALVAILTIETEHTLSVGLLEKVEDVELRQICMIDMGGALSSDEIQRLGGIQIEVLHALALARQAFQDPDPGPKAAAVSMAITLARRALYDNPNTNTLDLLFRFAKEVYRVDEAEAASFVCDMVVPTLAHGRVSSSVALLGLAECGHRFSNEQKAVIKDAWHMWAARWEKIEDDSLWVTHHPLQARIVIPTPERHRLAAKSLIDLAQHILSVDREHGLWLIQRASFHIGHTERDQRGLLQWDLLYAMLAAPDFEVWKKALTYALDYENAIFMTFDRFGRRLLESDPSAASRIGDMLDWSEQVMML